MEPTELEKVLLEKLSQGLLDGFVGPELYWRQDDAFCRRMIVGGIPYYISYSKNPHCANVTFLIEQYYETDEMKRWFLKMNGNLMSDPDVIEYGRTNK